MDSHLVELDLELGHLREVQEYVGRLVGGGERDGRHAITDLLAYTELKRSRLSQSEEGELSLEIGELELIDKYANKHMENGEIRPSHTINDWLSYIPRKIEKIERKLGDEL